MPPAIEVLSEKSCAHSLRVRSLGIKWSILLLSICSSGAIVFLGEDASTGVISLALLTGTALTVSQFDLLHPYSWYTPFFLLYSASTPILIWAGVKTDIGSLHETLILEWIALSIFILVVGPQKRVQNIPQKSFINHEIPAWLLFALSLALCALYLFGIWTYNLTSKYAIALADSPLLRLDPAFSVLSVTFAILVANSFLYKRIPWGLLFFTIGWMIFSFLLSGERDFIFRILWITIFLVHALYWRIPKSFLVTLGILGLTLVPLLGILKNALLNQGPISIEVVNLSNLMVYDEFITASENLQLLINESPWPFFFGETLWWDVKRALLPHFFVLSGPDPQRRFNEEFFPDVIAQGGGRGFTLVGEGYMNFGPVGVMIWFLLLGLFVRYIYIKSSRNVVWLVVYIVSMPLIIYITRADFSNLIAQFSKHIALPVIALFIGNRLLLGGISSEYRR